MLVIWQMTEPFMEMWMREDTTKLLDLDLPEFISWHCKTLTWVFLGMGKNT